MIIVLGLGNPGEKYQNTRHNVGFQTLDVLQKENNFPDFKLSRKFNSDITKGVLSGEKVILIKPRSFMNNSGKPAKYLMKFYDLQTSNLWIIHDDIDLPIGKFKIVKNRGSAGHKGVESIKNELKNNEFIRFRIGIQPKIGKPKSSESFVLQSFDKSEKKSLKNVIKKTAEAVNFSLKENIEKAMNEFNK
ncbi:aminoacyl-tRNA hydrolase [Patescibacteria group bacterium]